MEVIAGIFSSMGTSTRTEMIWRWVSSVSLFIALGILAYVARGGYEMEWTVVAIAFIAVAAGARYLTLRAAHRDQ